MTTTMPTTTVSLEGERLQALADGPAPARGFADMGVVLLEHGGGLWAATTDHYALLALRLGPALGLGPTPVVTGEAGREVLRAVPKRGRLEVEVAPGAVRITALDAAGEVRDAAEARAVADTVDMAAPFTPRPGAVAVRVRRPAVLAAVAELAPTIVRARRDLARLRDAGLPVELGPLAEVEDRIVLARFAAVPDGELVLEACGRTWPVGPVDREVEAAHVNVVIAAPCFRAFSAVPEARMHLAGRRGPIVLEVADRKAAIMPFVTRR